MRLVGHSVQGLLVLALSVSVPAFLPGWSCSPLLVFNNLAKKQTLTSPTFSF